MISNLKNRERN